jgi:hypothetical protein
MEVFKKNFELQIIRMQTQSKKMRLGKTTLECELGTTKTQLGITTLECELGVVKT